MLRDTPRISFVEEGVPEECLSDFDHVKLD
jgi:hypothetical protein